MIRSQIRSQIQPIVYSQTGRSSGGGGVTPETPPNDMFSEYLFENNGNDNVGSDNLVMVGSPTYSAGYENNAVNLNGSSQYGLRSVPTAFRIQTFSVSMFVKWDGTAANMSPISLAVLESGTNNIYGYIITLSSSGVYTFDIYNANPTPSNGTTVVENTSALTATSGVYQHICLTRGGGTDSFYVDGTLALQRTGSTMSTSFTQLVVGGYRQDVGTLFQPWSGQIDSIRYYSDVLTAGEVLGFTSPP